MFKSGFREGGGFGDVGIDSRVTGWHDFALQCGESDLILPQIQGKRTFRDPHAKLIQFAIRLACTVAEPSLLGFAVGHCNERSKLRSTKVAWLL